MAITSVFRRFSDASVSFSADSRRSASRASATSRLFIWGRETICASTKTSMAASLTGTFSAADEVLDDVVRVVGLLHLEDLLRPDPG